MEMHAPFRCPPLSNVTNLLQAGSRQYPAMMLATGDHDDRVVPLHSYKLVSQLQHALGMGESSPQRNPLLIRIEVAAPGGGVGHDCSQAIRSGRRVSVVSPVGFLR
jgi:prolyl oligopeptidase